MLGQRKNEFESGFLVMASANGTDYSNIVTVRTFAQKGTLDEAYPGTTPAIDDDIGILYTPAQNHPDFDSVSRTGLFSVNRVAIIEDEIIGFQTVTAEGASSYRLTGCIRGLFNTPISTHAASSVIWLTTLGDNVLGCGAGSALGQVASGSSFYTKFLTRTGSKIISASDASAINTTKEYKAEQPWPVCRIEAVRSGTTVTVTWWPTNQSVAGAGAAPGGDQTDQYPFAYDSDFRVSTSSSGPWTVYSNAEPIELTLNTSTTHRVYVQALRDGRLSDMEYVLVGTADGTYTGPEE
jgi:hypothetical protein